MPVLVHWIQIECRLFSAWACLKNNGILFYMYIRYLNTQPMSWIPWNLMHIKKWRLRMASIIWGFLKYQIIVQSAGQPTYFPPKIPPLNLMMLTPHFGHACSVSAVSLGSYNFSGSLSLSLVRLCALPLQPISQPVKWQLPAYSQEAACRATAVAVVEAARRLMIKCSAPSSLAPFAWL